VWKLNTTTSNEERSLDYIYYVYKRAKTNVGIFGFGDTKCYEERYVPVDTIIDTIDIGCNILVELHVERARTDRQTNCINHSTEEHARVIPFTATANSPSIH
jgi:hypothetical protein